MNKLDTIDSMKASAETVGVWAFVLALVYIFTVKTDKKYPVEYYRVFTGDDAEQQRAEWEIQQKKNKKKRGFAYCIITFLAYFFGIFGTIEVSKKYGLYHKI